MLIEELSSTGGSVNRSVTLQGPSLPFMGAEWGGSNKIKTTWYAGNADEATQQILVPMEMPSNWQGDWRRTMMGRAPAHTTDANGADSTIVSPFDLMNALEDIFRGGQRLRVTWSVAGDTSDARGKIIREGRAKEWKFKVTRIQDIEWEISFDWLGRGRSTQKVVSTRDDNMTSTTAALSASVSALASFAATVAFLSSNNTVRLSSTRFTLGQLESIANTPFAIATQLTRSLQQIMSNVRRVADLAKKIKGLPFAIANQAVDFARNTVGSANSFIDQISRASPEQLSLSSKVSDLARSAKYFGKSKSMSQDVARRAQEFAIKIRARQTNIGLQGQINPQSQKMRTQDILAIHITKTGDTPQRLSQKYYNSPDHYRDILRSNRLPLSQVTFPIGKPLIIPVITTQQQGA